jgi:hypothetical protein
MSRPDELTVPRAFRVKIKIGPVAAASGLSSWSQTYGSASPSGWERAHGPHSELAERLAEVVVDGAGADEQPRGDFSVGGTISGEAGDLCFLGGQEVVLSSHLIAASETSMGFTPAARSLIRICPARGSGVGISATAGVPPYSLTVTARIEFSLPWGSSGRSRHQADLGAQPRSHLRDRRVDLGNSAGPNEEVVLPLGQRA